MDEEERDDEIEGVEYSMAPYGETGMVPLEEEEGPWYAQHPVRALPPGAEQSIFDMNGINSFVGKPSGATAGVFEQAQRPKHPMGALEEAMRPGKPGFESPLHLRRRAKAVFGVGRERVGEAVTLTGIPGIGLAGEEKEAFERERAGLQRSRWERELEETAKKQVRFGREARVEQEKLRARYGSMENAFKQEAAKAQMLIRRESGEMQSMDGSIFNKLTSEARQFGVDMSLYNRMMQFRKELERKTGTTAAVYGGRAAKATAATTGQAGARLVRGVGRAGRPGGMGTMRPAQRQPQMGGVRIDPTTIFSVPRG